MTVIETPTPIQSRLRAIQEKRDAPHPSKFASLYPVRMSPVTRMARAGQLTPTIVCGGSVVLPDGRHAA